MNIRPMNGRVLVEPSESPDEAPGGIVIPDSAKEKPCRGTVLAVADDATEEVAVGDQVMYKEFGGTEVTVDDRKYVLLSSDDILVKYIETDAIPE